MYESMYSLFGSAPPTRHIVAVLSRCCTDPGCTVNHNRPERSESRDDVQRVSVANQRRSISLWYLLCRHISTQTSSTNRVRRMALPLALRLGTANPRNTCYIPGRRPV